MHTCKFKKSHLKIAATLEAIQRFRLAKLKSGLIFTFILLFYRHSHGAH